ncbi:MAG: hypothetical protein FD156_1454 [Nitrospirae bacterium]|nr:MAG: hypothetical protein FD156_1454 [Nitrospirota bacterium]
MFVDAQEMHRKYPATFEVPPDDSLSLLSSGDRVKVSHNGERFWVAVKGIFGNIIAGTVDNFLTCDHPFGQGDVITFEKRHIHSVYKGE